MKQSQKYSFLCMLALALVLVLAAGSAPTGVASAAAPDLFFSEYIEGSSNNKALEVYNGTGAPVDLTGYTIEQYSNGSTTVSLRLDLSGTLANGDVYVVAHSSSDPAILAQADLTTSAGLFNGDDALVLVKDGAVVDSIGQVGFDPGTEWGSGDTSTADNTLRRKADICAGDTNPFDEFDPAVEWDGFPQNTFDGLGAHTASCDDGSPTDPVINEFSASHTGTDDHEYIEIFGAPNTDYSAYTVLQIEGDALPSGTIDSVHPVGTTDANGLWLGNLAANTLENGTITLLLVEGFTGNVGDDLDTDNDGVFDVEPWLRVVDDVAVHDGDAGDLTYATTVLTDGYDGLSFPPGGASRIPDGTDTDSPADWVRNDFDLAGIPGFDGTPEAGEALNTPGAPNALVEVEPEAAALVINEIDYNQPSTDTAEFVEIRNNSDSGVNLSSYTLEFVNGSNNTVYQSFALPNVVLASGDYFVLCGDAANVANCDLDVTPDSNLIQNGDPDAIALLLDGEIVDTVSYGGDVPGYTEGSGAGLTDSDAPGIGISRCPDGMDTDQNNVDFAQASITPGEANDCDDNGGGGDDELCGDPFTPIYDIQGSGAASPIVGQIVSTEGVVVGDFQPGDGDLFDSDLGGFYIQDPTGDGDPATSDGIFVFAPGSQDVAVGDAVRVRGRVDEHFNLTELTSVSSVQVCGTGTVEPVVLTLPVDSIDDLEQYEGMLVTFPQELYISEYFNFDRFGEIVLSAERQFQPTAVAEPGSPEAEAIAQANALGRIMLDDARNTENPDPARHPNGAIFDLTNLFRGGDTVSNVTGILSFDFGLYRIQPTTGADYQVQNPRPEAHDEVGGSLEVASFNVLNYFTTLGSRGADTPEEFQRQHDKIVAAISEIDADIVGLIEIENNDAAIANLVNGLNDVMGPGTYAYIDTGVIGTDEIKVALIYKPATVSPVGDYAILDSSKHPLFDDTRNRPMLTQSFEENASGEVVTVSVNHLKSKGSACGPGDDDPVQGNCNLTRTLAAQAIVEWLATDPTNSGDPDHLIIGDLNAYDKEDPIDVLVDNGYTDLVLAYEGELAYSYVFDGQLGYLDHALANESLTSQVTGATVWNINADEPDLIDYDMTFKKDPQDELYEPNAYRSSDHDPVIVGLALESNAAPVCEAAVPSQSSLWPPNHKFIQIDILGVTDPEGDPFTIIIDSIFQDEAVDAPDSGNTAPDGQGVGTSSAQVRAERVGTGNGRVYHIAFTATDDGGASCSGVVQVGVPVSRNSTPIDDGPLYDSTEGSTPQVRRPKKD